MKRSLAILTVIVCMLVMTGSALADANKSAARNIINHVFTVDKQYIMLKVAGCETGGIYNSNAHNSSGASGYFQILSSHDGTTYTFNGISITVDRTRLFDGYYNTLVAYLMSKGGTDLSPWYSSRGCWD